MQLWLVGRVIRSRGILAKNKPSPQLQAGEKNRRDQQRSGSKRRANRANFGRTQQANGICDNTTVRSVLKKMPDVTIRTRRHRNHNQQPCLATVAADWLDTPRHNRRGFGCSRWPGLGQRGRISIRRRRRKIRRRRRRLRWKRKGIHYGGRSSERLPCWTRARVRKLGPKSHNREEQIASS